MDNSGLNMHNIITLKLSLSHKLETYLIGQAGSPYATQPGGEVPA